MLNSAYQLGASNAEDELLSYLEKLSESSDEQFEKEAGWGKMLQSGWQLARRAAGKGHGVGKQFKAFRSGAGRVWRGTNTRASKLVDGKLVRTHGQVAMKGPAAASRVRQLEALGVNPALRAGGLRSSLSGQTLRGAGWLTGLSGRHAFTLGMPTGMGLMGAATAGEGQRLKGFGTGFLGGLGAVGGMKGVEKLTKVIGGRVGKGLRGTKAWEAVGRVGSTKTPGRLVTGEGLKLQRGLRTAGKGALGVGAFGAGFYGFGKGHELGEAIGGTAGNELERRYNLSNQWDNASAFNPARYA
jgi:hypothetical protein